ncbi:hypothetical protein BESB_074260 [Besnoitia besnoiti]|uniref:Probable cytosolic iron-sulfur protein assembly protein CIAO1 homolog n=1 Tax=Besnoitia besnoiti TaxID=94643 RepID=A0A2A9MAP6_BESBE|nr:uncharacterized protein BESB_074260 [Besnoitia besnoiti]PFH34274.1 hypothetical protein BESB_074260 [Besnoitia besnoiti]
MTGTWRLRRVVCLRGHVGCAWDAAWRPDGGLLATCGSDKRICLWGPSVSFALGPNAPAGDRSSRQPGASGEDGETEGRKRSEATAEGGACAPEETRRARGDSPLENRMSEDASDAFAETTRQDEHKRRRKTSYPSWYLVGVLDTTATHSRTLRSVAFSPDGVWLAAASFDATVSVWGSNIAGVYRTPSRFHQVQVLEGPEHEVKCVAWSRTGRYLATCSRDKTVWIFENAQGDLEPIATAACRSRRRALTHRVPSPSPRGGACDTTEGRQKADAEAPGAADACETERETEGSADLFLEERQDWPEACQLEVDVADDEFFFVAAVLSGHSQDVKAVRWHPIEDICISASYDDSFRVWGLRGGAGSDWGLLQVVKAHSSTVWSLAFDRLGGRLATCSDDRSLKIWTLQSFSVCAPACAWRDMAFIVSLRRALLSACFVRSFPELGPDTDSSSAASSSARSSPPASPISAFSSAVALPAQQSSRLPPAAGAGESPEPAAEAAGLSPSADASSGSTDELPGQRTPAAAAPPGQSSAPPTALASRVLPPWFVTGLFRGAALGPAGPWAPEGAQGEAPGGGGNGDAGDANEQREDEGEGRDAAANRRRRGHSENADDGGAEPAGGSAGASAEEADGGKRGIDGGVATKRAESASRRRSARDAEERRDRDEISRQQPGGWRPQAALLSGFHPRPVYFVDWHPTLDVIVTASGDSALRFFSAENAEVEDSSWGLLLSKPDAHYSDINCAVWNPATPSSSRRSQVLLGTPESEVTAALLASVDDDGKVAIWALEACA